MDALMPAITARRLPPAEWAEKLVGTSLDGVRLDPSHSMVIVVEDEDGLVVACWSAMTTVHVEGLWEAPSHQGGAGVGRALLTTMIRELKAEGVGEVLTQSLTPEIDEMLRRAGAKVVPGTTWVLLLGGH